MRTVIVSCATGGTSGLFGEKIKKSALTQSLKAYVDSVGAIRDKSRWGKILEMNLDLLILYAPTDLFLKSDILEIQKDKIHMVFIAPQMRYLKNHVVEKANKYGVPVEDIPMEDFGKMQGDNVLRIIMK